ncbi:Ger(x)C family spore germination protein [Paenibacillus sp. 1001270B_150601_E10]|uniref:Ger(x)C family spore germination protein n=1 Tax=Paenibacillus sp. 1001270B_150601_E10 TaxID=2787079 RepID=UPI00189CF981|nr:Ger(x)C family spore germination protein [Paenibacillus sp. 1001270B_150601_E10]
MRRSMLFFLCIASFLVTTGCWNRTELDTLGIAAALGIDKLSEQEYLVSVQIVNPVAISSKKGTGEAPVYVVEERGKTIQEALRRMTTQIPRKVYLAHLRMVVFGEDVARGGLVDIIDFLVRDHEMRGDTFMVIAEQGRANKILGIIPRLEEVPANKLFKSIEMSQANWAPTIGVHLDNFIKGAISLGRQPVATGVKIIGAPEAGTSIDMYKKTFRVPYIKIPSIAVFKKDKLIGYLNESESKGYNYILNTVKSTIGVVSCKDGNATLEIIHSGTKMKGKVVNGKPEIHIYNEIETKISEINCKVDLADKDVIMNLEQKGSETISRVLHSTVVAAQKKYNSDILGFGNAIRRADHKYWKKNARHWDDIFPTLKVIIHVNVHIKEIGTQVNSMKWRYEEQLREVQS